MSALREYLEAEVAIRKLMAAAATASPWEYSSPADLVLREGVDWQPAPYGGAVEWRFEGEPRNCFQNAFQLAELWPDDLAYVEGYAGRMIVVNHAWCVSRKTRAVVDPTWGDEPGDEYRGIAFDLDYVDEVTTARGMYGILDDWQQKWPLLHQPLDPSIVDPIQVDADS